MRTKLLLMFLIAVAVAGCIHDTPEEDPELDDFEDNGMPDTDPAAPEDEEADEDVDDADPVFVEVGDDYFEPETVEAAPGQQMLFQNVGENVHTVTIPEAELDHELDPDEAITVSIAEEGTYGLECTLHEDMAGEIIIES